MPLEQDHSNLKHGTLPTIAGIDGLRALAVAAVLLYHADISWMQGGFLGVEAFFVISGFLITNVLCAEWNRNGRIDLVRFWLRRARRLLPALFVLLAAVAAFVVRAVPAEAAALRGDIIAALSYVTNWWLIFRQQSYFEAMGRPPPLQHLWSLAVEEQFYLIWPLVCSSVFGVFQIFRRTRVHVPNAGVPPTWLNGVQRITLGVIALVGALGSTWLMAAQYQPETDPSRIYYGSDTRVAGLLIGAALALLWAPWKDRQIIRRDPVGDAYDSLRQPTWLERAISLLLDLIGVATLAMLASAMVRLSEFDPRLYQGGFLLVALLTAILIFAIAHPAARLVTRLLETAPLRWLGTRSYSIYLWHWPIIIFTRPQLDIALDGVPLFGLRLGLTITLAELSFRLIERPVRNGVTTRWWQTLGKQRTDRRLLAIASGMSTSVLIVGVTGWLGVALARATPQPLPQELASIADDANTALPLDERANSALSVLPTALSAATASVTAASGPEVAATMPAAVATATMLRASAVPTAVLLVVPTAPPLLPTEAPPRRAASTAAHIFAIGDSVMVGATKELHRALADIEIDARVSRQAKQALAILQARHDAGQLGDGVIIHIGTNGPFSLDRFEGMMAAVGTTRRVVVVNVKVPRRWEDANNAMLAAAAQRYPNVRFVDWRAASIDRPELFGRDGIHLKPAGAQLYASLIAQAFSEP